MDHLVRSDHRRRLAAAGTAHTFREGCCRPVGGACRTVRLRILLTGRSGQVGWELERRLRPLGEISAPDRVLLDLGRPETVAAAVRSSQPDLIVNAAAYTAVDQAEREASSALTVNGESVGVLAYEAARLGAL